MKNAIKYLKGIKTPFLCKLGLHKLTEWSDCYAGYERKYCLRCMQSFNMDIPEESWWN